MRRSCYVKLSGATVIVLATNLWNAYHSWPLITEAIQNYFGILHRKGSDWIRLVFAHPFPLNIGAPIASANCPTNGDSVIQDQRVGTIKSLSSQTIWKLNGNMKTKHDPTQCNLFPGIWFFARIDYLVFCYTCSSLHPASATGVIVLTLCVCPCVCYHSPRQTNRHKDLNFGM